MSAERSPTRRMNRAVQENPWKTLGLAGVVGIASAVGSMKVLLEASMVEAAEAKIVPQIKEHGAETDRRIEALWDRYRDLDTRLRAAEVKLGSH